MLLSLQILFFVFVYPICALFISSVISNNRYFEQNPWFFACLKLWTSTVVTEFNPQLTKELINKVNTQHTFTVVFIKLVTRK